MKTRLRSILSYPLLFPGVLLATAFLTYGFVLSKMGFYWDDWQAIYVHRLGSPALFWQYYSYDRPVSAWTYVLSFPLLGSRPAAWQAFTIGLRWLGAVGLWASLRGMWPERPRAVAWMALFWLVYPGFTQQSISVAYSQHFITYALFTSSLALMIWRQRHPKWRFGWAATGLAVAASLLQLLTMEYFAGLELLRPIILFMLLAPLGLPLRRRIGQAAIRWAPYAAALAAFVVLRFWVYPRISPEPDSNAPLLLLAFFDNPLQQTIRLAQIMIQDLVHLNLFAWLNTIQPANIVLTDRISLATWAGGGLVAALMLVVSRFQPADVAPDTGRPDAFLRQAPLLGALGMLLGGLPVWLTDRQVIVGLWSDRFALAPMFGVVIFIPALIFLAIPRRLHHNLVLAGLAVLAVAGQMTTVYTYRRNWSAQTYYYWQLAWRAPGLQPGTLLLGNKMPFGLVSDYAVAYATNIMYAPDADATRPPYWFLSALRYVDGLIPSFTPGHTVKYPLRNVLFEGTTSQALVLSRDNSNQCVRIQTPDDALSPEVLDQEKDLVGIGQLAPILVDTSPAITPPVEIFGAAPVNTWCEVFEKADLARQRHDDAESVRLYEDASARGLRTKYGVEMLPFIESYARLGQWEAAARLTSEAAGKTAGMQPYLCSEWERYLASMPASDERTGAAQSIRKELQCDTLTR